MPLKLTYYYNGIYPSFELYGDVVSEDITEFLDILEKLLLLKTPFVFILKGTEITTFPAVMTSYTILNWMRKNYKNIPDVLLASAVVINNETIVNMLSWILKTKKPISPNLITNCHDDALKFVDKYLPSELKK